MHFIKTKSENIDILLNFTNSLSTVDHTLMVLSSIYKAVKSNVGINVMRILNLMSILELNVFITTDPIPNERC